MLNKYHLNSNSDWNDYSLLFSRSHALVCHLHQWGRLVSVCSFLRDYQEVTQKRCNTFIICKDCVLIIAHNVTFDGWQLEKVRVNIITIFNARLGDGNVWGNAEYLNNVTFYEVIQIFAAYETRGGACRLLRRSFLRSIGLLLRAVSR